VERKNHDSVIPGYNDGREVCETGYLTTYVGVSGCVTKTRGTMYAEYIFDSMSYPA
jgi:hypothetical protein